MSEDSLFRYSIGLGIRMTSTFQLSPALENTSSLLVGDPREMSRKVPPGTRILAEGGFGAGSNVEWGGDSATPENGWEKGRLGSGTGSTPHDVPVDLS